MDNNLLSNLFDKFNEEKVKYCVRGRYVHLPETLDGGDVDLLIDKKDFLNAKEIIENLGFRFYPRTNPNLFYYFYDKNLGLIQLDILVNKVPPLKKYKNFHVPFDGKQISNKKTILEKIKTGLIRRAYWSFRGPVIVFEGPDGSGKTSNAKALYESLSKFPMKKDFVHFATSFIKGKKPSPFRRLKTRIKSIFRVYRNIIFGRMTITDRYIYLTFRKHHPFLGKLLRSFAPTPKIMFLARADIATIRERKEGQRDLLSPEMIKELYSVYEDVKGPKIIEIDTTNDLKENSVKIANSLLNEILK